MEYLPIPRRHIDAYIGWYVILGEDLDGRPSRKSLRCHGRGSW